MSENCSNMMIYCNFVYDYRQVWLKISVHKSQTVMLYFNNSVIVA